MVLEVQERDKTVCFTGHRPKAFGTYNEFDPTIALTKLKLRDTIKECMENGIEFFISGGAIGVDIWAGEEVLGCGGKLIVAKPFPSQHKIWPKAVKKRYFEMLKQAITVYDINEDPYENWKMQSRNEWMVDNSCMVIAVWGGKKGGTYNCVKYAEKKKVPVYRINPWE